MTGNHKVALVLTFLALTCGKALGSRQLLQSSGNTGSSTSSVGDNGAVEVCYSALDVIGAINNTEGNLTIFTEALFYTGLAEVLADASLAATVFAPTDAAFMAAAQQMNLSVDDLLASPNLIPILLYHILSQPVLTTQLKNQDILPTLLGQYLNVTLDTDDDGDEVELEATESDATIIDGDYCNCDYCNIVVDVIDDVLLPDIINTTTNTTGNEAETLITIGNEYGTIQRFLVVTDSLSPIAAPPQGAAPPISGMNATSSGGIRLAPTSSRSGGITTSTGTTYYTNSEANA